MNEKVESSPMTFQDESENFWNGLSKEDQLKAFYAVTKRIHKADLVDNGTYRHCLYNVFGFDPSAYCIGMESGYFDIHNSIMSEHKWTIA